jgi:hypothetical protein
MPDAPILDVDDQDVLMDVPPTAPERVPPVVPVPDSDKKDSAPHVLPEGPLDAPPPDAPPAEAPLIERPQPEALPPEASRPEASPLRTPAALEPAGMALSAESPTKSTRKTFLATGNRTSSRSKTQLAPPAVLPETPATTEGDDDALAAPREPGANPLALPDTARINFPLKLGPVKMPIGRNKVPAVPRVEAKPEPRRRSTPALPPAPVGKPHTVPTPRSSAAALLERTILPVNRDEAAPKLPQRPTTAEIERTILPVNRDEVASGPKAAASPKSPPRPSAVKPAERDDMAKAHGGISALKSPKLPMSPKSPQRPPQIELDWSLDDETLADGEPEVGASSPPPRAPATAFPRRLAPAGRRGRGGVGKYLVMVLAVVLLGTGGYFVYSFLFGGPTRRPVFPAEGVVMFQGKPAVGARVTFIPIEKSRDRYFPTGKVGEDGTYKLSTYEPGDGAPAGRYNVTVARGQLEADEYDELNKKMSPQEVARHVQKLARDPLYQKYANPQKSGLTAEIKPSATKLEPFDLK